MGTTGLHGLLWTRWIHMALLTHMAPLVPMDPTGKIGPKADVLDGPCVLMGQAHGAQDPGPYLRTADLSKIVFWKHMVHVKK